MSEAIDTTLLNMEDALSMNLDEVAEAPDFVDPPTGNYILTIMKAGLEEYETKDRETKEDVKRKRLRVSYAISSTVELAKPGEDKVPNGSMFSETFMLNKDGLSFFKKQAVKILGADNIAQVHLQDILTEMSNKHFFEANVRMKESTKGEGEDRKTFRNANVRIGNVIELPALPEGSWIPEEKE